MSSKGLYHGHVFHLVISEKPLRETALEHFAVFQTGKYILNAAHAPGISAARYRQMLNFVILLLK